MMDKVDRRKNVMFDILIYRCNKVSIELIVGVRKSRWKVQFRRRHQVREDVLIEVAGVFFARPERSKQEFFAF